MPSGRGISYVTGQMQRGLESVFKSELLSTSKSIRSKKRGGGEMGNEEPGHLVCQSSLGYEENRKEADVEQSPPGVEKDTITK